ncbi:uncharacterized protein LOC100839978 [Brachypodium distachyon]|uniref:PWWP domain-containing protein n=1 Tax=Brachypodium distachyon TaxID=15368 RepID=I1GQU2_BRADI|nr:uncharacterized protein LOC100839978 [Brachypodium distachyon]KQK14469.1 hypothetical protein BRADI_1g16527v3 [Brachypodium distachyon]|eukprot:XP_003562399.3 uncharacterized protein LOC100839978 [Brachypodium distachyon]
MSEHIDLNTAADPQTLAPPKRGRGRPRKNPPPPPPPPPRPPPTTSSPTTDPSPFAPKDMVWGKKLTHPAWPGEVLSVAAAGTQLLVSFFGDKALAWCDAAEVRPYQAYFPVGELYDGEAEDFDAAVDASLHEFSRRVQAALTAADSPTSVRRPFVPPDFISSLKDLAADRSSFSNRVQAAITEAHLRAFDKFRGFPDPPEFVLELGIPNEEALATHSPMDGVSKGAREGNCNSSTPPRRGRKRKEEVQQQDSDEDWDPRKKGATDSDTDVDMERKRASRGRGSSGAPRGRPRGRPRKTDAVRAPQVKDEEMEEKIEYPSAAELLLQLTSVAADPFNFNGYDSVHLIFSFFSKHKDSEVPTSCDDKELLQALGGKKGRKKSVGSFTKAECDIEEEQLDVADGQRGRRKSAGSIYSARKAEDSYWCDIIISDFDDGDTSSDYEGRKRKRVSQNRSGIKKMKEEVVPQDEAAADSPDAKLADGEVK